MLTWRNLFLTLHGAEIDDNTQDGALLYCHFFAKKCSWDIKIFFEYPGGNEFTEWAIASISVFAYICYMSIYVIVLAYICYVSRTCRVRCTCVVSMSVKGVRAVLVMIIIIIIIIFYQMYHQLLCLIKLLKGRCNPRHEPPIQVDLELDPVIVNTFESMCVCIFGHYQATKGGVTPDMNYLCK